MKPWKPDHCSQRRDLVFDSRLDVEVVENRRIMRSDDSSGGVELDEIGALDVAGQIEEVPGGEERDEPGDPHGAADRGGE